MKRFSCLVINIFLIASTTVSCLVTNQISSRETVTEESVREVAKDSGDGIKVDDKSQIYNDVIQSLKNQNWTDEEQLCVEQINRMVRGLQNFTLWAVWVWDTQTSEPQGQLFANKYQLGNFDQCMNAPWTDSHDDLHMKYCLVDIVLERPDNGHKQKLNKPFSPYQSAIDFIEYHPPHTRPLNELTWGVCTPVSCLPSTIEKLMAVMLARSHLGAAGLKARIAVNEKCQTNEDQSYDGLFHSFVILMGSLISICLVCTYYNCTRQLESNSASSNLIRAFCMNENASDLLKMRKDGSEVIYGIKWLTMCLIVVDHQIGIGNAGPISNGLTSDNIIQSFLGLFILHDDLFVDTFFLLSGFLTISSFASLKKLPNPLIVILRRYIRLVAALSVVVFYVSAVYPYTGTGPLWNKAITAETEACRKNWWLNLLMISNYVDTENICIVISWYIPCDFHFFLVTIIGFFLYKKYPKIGVITGGVLFAVALLIPGIMTYMYQLAAVQLFTIEFVMNPRANEDFHLLYIKSHARFASYLVGVFGGFIFVKYKAEGKLSTISKKWSAFGTIAALTLMLAVMMYGSTFIWREYQPLESAIYAAFNRPVWAFGVGLLVMCCSFGQLQIVKSFLSWYPFVPLSRLTYGLYLTHTIIIMRNVFVTRNPRHNDYFEILSSSAGTVFWGSISALLLWLLVEAPVNKLFTFLISSKINIETVEENQHPTQSNNSTSVEISNTGHLRDNLPTRIHFTSKI
ncbi:nose resistant to fluoxetine protein 6-like [Bombyx mandarina]|uniref:Nose resistant to fluoxetine protein 6-like n=1 Tax=Bombyx mandarina TaxID=7092 RepID=A0A6J2KEH2_BOMMA|nr:nose resistant to fluoxetine protein 6-like [Bombyx mandarina]